MRLALLTLALLVYSAGADAASTCTFDVSDSTMRLRDDCTTDTTLVIPDRYTLDGQHFTITAIDPVGGHFVGAVVMNGGELASVVDANITAAALADVCDSGAARLRGIFFDGASGTIRGNTVSNVNQGASRCQEGNAIEVRNLPPRGEPTKVEIDSNVIERFQKTGIVVAGDVDAFIHDNEVGPSADQDYLPANGVQVGYGAWAAIVDNRIAGNGWQGGVGARDVATAVLLYRAAPGSVVRANMINGNADIGIYLMADETTVEANRIEEEGPDVGMTDIGIADYGSGNRVSGNVVSGYQLPVDTIENVKSKLE